MTTPTPAPDRTQRTKRTATAAAIAAVVIGAVVPLLNSAINEAGSVTLVDWSTLWPAALTAAVTALFTWLMATYSPPS